MKGACYSIYQPGLYKHAAHLLHIIPFDLRYDRISQAVMKFIFFITNDCTCRAMLILSITLIQKELLPRFFRPGHEQHKLKMILNSG